MMLIWHRAGVGGAAEPASLGFKAAILRCQVLQGYNYVTDQRTECGLLLKAHCRDCNCMVEAPHREVAF